MTQEPSFRAALPEDAALLQAIAEAAYALYVPRIGRRPAPMDTDFAADVPASRVLCAPGPVGYLTGRMSGDVFHLEALGLVPAVKGRGFGRLLITEAERMARAEGAAAVELYTNARMTENLALYPHLGFHCTGRRTEDGFDRVFFRKDLPR